MKELTEEMKKSIEEMVDQTMAKFSSEEDKKEDVEKSEEVAKTEEIVANSTQPLEDPTAKTSEVEKSVDKDVDRDSNGGKDKIKSGNPMSEKQSMMKSDDSEGEEEEKKEMKEVASKEVDDHEDKMHKKMSKKMKKSLEELSDILADDELEVIAAWREATAPQESVAKSGLAESNNNSEVLSKLDSLAKSLEAKDELIKSLSDKVEKLSSQPAYDKRSIDNLEPVEKSEEGPSSNLTKSQVLDTMLDLQKSGKGITSYHIAEFEATGNISNAGVREQVLNKLKSK